MAIHEELLVRDGGLVGLRDAGLLQSALARPRQLAAYGQGVDAIDLAAAYTAAVVQNHPFADGNKRTGFVLGVLFLELNGCEFMATEEAATHAVLALAAGEMDALGYRDFLRDNARRPA